MKKTMALLTFAMAVSACSPETKVQTVPSTGPTTPVATTAQNNQIEGTVNGGGGKGVLCKKNGQETLEILDLYEGRALYGLKFSKKYNSLDEAVSDMIEAQLSYSDYNLITTSQEINQRIKSYETTRMNRVRAKIKFVDASKSLKSTDDANEAVVENDCESKQIAVYYDENILLVDKKLWDKLDYLNQAALLLHEVVYFNARKSGVKDSVSSRKYVAHLLADQGLSVPFKKMPREQIFFCPLAGYAFESAFGVYVTQQGTTGKPSVLLTTTLFAKLYQTQQGPPLRQTMVIEGLAAKELANLQEQTPERRDEIISLLQKSSFEIFEDTVKDPVSEGRDLVQYLTQAKFGECRSLVELDKEFNKKNE